MGIPEMGNITCTLSAWLFSLTHSPIKGGGFGVWEAGRSWSTWVGLGFAVCKELVKRGPAIGRVHVRLCIPAALVLRCCTVLSIAWITVKVLPPLLTSIGQLLASQTPRCVCELSRFLIV